MFSMCPRISKGSINKNSKALSKTKVKILRNCLSACNRHFVLLWRIVYVKKVALVVVSCYVSISSQE